MNNVHEPKYRRMLVVGNGFDLAHNLPTRYQDMLNALKSLSSKHDCENNWLDSQKIISYISNPFIKYFMSRMDLDGWTGFESEIRTIVNYFKKPFKASERPTLDIDLKIETCFRTETDLWKSLNIRSLWKELKKDLDILIEYIDQYLSIYLPTVFPKTLSDCAHPHFIYKRNYHFLLSFNYTNTYYQLSQTVDDIGRDVPLASQFIHGEHSINGQSQNIVLGIEDDDPSNLDTVYFKKYFQRIQKRTGREFYNWIDPSYNPGDPIIVDVFGHSLDTTDKDVLLALFEGTLFTNIYYFDQSDYERKIINLIRLYGSPEEFTNRYYGNKIRLRKISTEDERYMTL